MFAKLFCRFTDHPKNVCMSYFQHFLFSFKLSIYFLKKSIQAFVHSIYPNFYITSSSNVPTELKQKFSQVGCQSNTGIH